MPYSPDSPLIQEASTLGCLPGHPVHPPATERGQDHLATTSEIADSANASAGNQPGIKQQSTSDEPVTKQESARGTTQVAGRFHESPAIIDDSGHG